LARHLLLVINFIREVISGFCTQDDNLIKIKIWGRLRNLVELQRKLVGFITEFGDVLPNLPFAYTLEHSHHSLNSFGKLKIKTTYILTIQILKTTIPVLFL